MKIRLRNFQSIVDAEIEVRGFTVVTGQNNAGKSALMRALAGLFQNASSDAFVRHGEDHFIVDVSFDDGKSVTWKKGPKVKPTYVVDGYTIHPGRQVPDEVSAMGIRPIYAGTVPLWPQVAPQFSGQLFLVDQPGSVIAESVADVDKVSNLTGALRLSESDKRSASTLLKTRRSDRDGASRDLARYDDVESYISRMEQIEVAVLASEEQHRRIQSIEQLRRSLLSAKSEVDRYAFVRQVPTLSDSIVPAAQKVRRSLEYARDLRSKLGLVKADMRRLQPVRLVKTPSPHVDATEIRRSLLEALRLRNRLHQSKSDIQRLRSILDSVRSATPNPTIETKIIRTKMILTVVTSYRDRKKSLVREIEEIKRSIALVETSIGETIESINHITKLIGKCPACGAEVSHVHGS